MSAMVDSFMLKTESELENSSHWVCQSSTGVSMNELKSYNIPIELFLNLRKAMRETISCLSSSLERKNTLGRALLPATISKNMPTQISHKLYSTLLQTTIDGKYLINENMTKQDKKIHKELLSEVKEWMEERTETILFKDWVNSKNSFYVLINNKDWIKVVVKPDGYALFNTKHGLANIIIEVAPRGIRYVPSDWLTAYMIPFYLSNLRPTFTLIVTPLEVRAYYFDRY